IYQCALPVFEGLFPDPQHDKTVQDLLFTLAEWHATAKLRLHTDSTLDTLRKATQELGARLRAFAKNICPSYDTKELPREEAARKRRNLKAATIATSSNTQPDAGNTIRSISGPKRQKFNLTTSKLHVLGDYVSHIIQFGTTDSYSTQAVSMITHDTTRRL
ncbi:hypothetical protein K474DRAFT_1751300, partial [Panus rudis PR-1116 ss-1]